MKRRSEQPDSTVQLREKLIGLGKTSIRKSYFPALQARLNELERFRALLDQSREIILLLDAGAGRVVDANEHAGLVLAGSLDRLVGQDFRAFLEQDEEQTLDLLLAEIRASGSGTTQGALRLATPQAGSIPLEFTARLLRFIDQDYIAIVGRDIGQRLQAEKTLRQWADAFQFCAHGLAIGLPGSNTILVCNPAFAAILGRTVEELAGQPIYSVYAAAEHAVVRGHIAEADRTGYARYETLVQHADGSTVPVQMDLVSVRGATGVVEYRVATMQDIRARKQAEEQRLALESQLRQAQKMEAIGILAGGIAHDFNNILSGVIGFAEMALELANQGRPNQAELEQVLRAADRAGELVKQILAFSRKVESDPRPMNLNDSVASGLALLGRSLPKMIEIEINLAPDLVPVNADPTQMEQILLNLATNAADAMPMGGRLTVETQNVTLDEHYCRLHLGATPGDYALLQVSDTGQGMDAHTREHIFDPFFTTKEVGKGTGLGLASVYGIVKAHGGQIYCYSEPGLGASFKVYLPAHHGGSTASPKPIPPPESGLLGRERILLVDDEESLRQLGETLLSQMGYQVTTAGSGEEALDLYRTRSDGFDLVVLDLGMPGMGGHRCLEALLANDPTVRVVVASGYSAHSQVRESLAAGARAFVAKPFRRVELLSAVRSVLDRP
ncbi:MAG: response regulator [Desulfarculus sp.]|nr:response regulator [Desulfarculus sp.]